MRQKHRWLWIGVALFVLAGTGAVSAEEVPDLPAELQAEDDAAAALVEAGKQQEALAAYEALAKKLAATVGADDVRCAAIEATRIVACLNQLARFQEAATRCDRVIASTEERYKGVLWAAHLGAAQARASLGQLGHGRRHCEHALSFARTDEERIMVLSWLSNVHRLEGSLEAAVQRLTEARDLAQQSSEHAAELENIRNTLAAVQFTQGDYAAAKEGFTYFLAAAKARHGSDSLKVAYALTNLAGVEAKLGGFRRALDRVDKALAIYERRLDPDDLRVGYAELARGTAAYRAGAQETATEAFASALRIFRKTLGPSHPTTANAHVNLASVYMQSQDPGRARAHYEHGIQIYEQRQDRDRTALVLALNNYGAFLRVQGARDEALVVLSRAEKLARAHLSPTHPHVASNLQLQAQIAASRGEWKQVATLLQDAFAIRAKVFGATHFLMARLHSLLARTHVHLGEPDEAIRHVNKAVEIVAHTLGKDHVEYANSMVERADILARCDDPQAANRALRTALAVFDAAGLRTYASAWARTEVAVFLAREGELDAASDQIRQALEERERETRRTLAFLPRAHRLLRARGINDLLGKALRVARLREEDGYDLLLRCKGLVGRATEAERRIARSAAKTSGREIMELRALERRLSVLVNEMPPRRAKAKRAAWQATYARLAGERERRATALARVSAPMRQQLERLALGREDVQAALGAGEVLLDFLVVARRLLAWVVPREGAIVRLDLGPVTSIEKAASAFADALLDGGEDDELRRVGGTLRNRVFAPLRQRLPAGTHTLVICPDGPIAALPFAALPGLKPDTWLIDEFTLVRVSMAQDLIPQDGADSGGSGMLILGAIDYGHAREADPGAPSAAAERASRGTTYLPLPGTKAEIASVRAAAGSNVVTLTGADATEAAVRTGAKGRERLHMATHGYVRPYTRTGLRKRSDTWLGVLAERQLAVGHDPLLLAGLALSGANERQGSHGDDGTLTALEISHLHLDGVEEVVLSACETALGQAQIGEGVMGLVWAFQLAGARSVVGSLWRVDDEATRLLMAAYYAARTKKEGALSPWQALRQAALAVRATQRGSKTPYRHPRFWAPFVAYRR